MSGPKSSNRPKIIAVIPAYNEEKYVGTIVLKARQYVSEVIVLDFARSEKIIDRQISSEA